MNRMRIVFVLTAGLVPFDAGLARAQAYRPPPPVYVPPAPVFRPPPVPYVPAQTILRQQADVLQQQLRTQQQFLQQLDYQNKIINALDAAQREAQSQAQHRTAFLLGALPAGPSMALLTQAVAVAGAVGSGMLAPPALGAAGGAVAVLPTPPPVLRTTMDDKRETAFLLTAVRAGISPTQLRKALLALGTVAADGALPPGVGASAGLAAVLPTIGARRR
jgi:hypothetical protein